MDISEPDDFVVDDDELDHLDGVTMMLIAMGEQLKRLEKAGEHPPPSQLGSAGVVL